MMEDIWAGNGQDKAIGKFDDSTAPGYGSGSPADFKFFTKAYDLNTVDDQGGTFSMMVANYAYYTDPRLAFSEKKYGVKSLRCSDVSACPAQLAPTFPQ